MKDKRIDGFKGPFSTLVTDSSMPLEEMEEMIIEYYLPILKARYDEHPKRAKYLEEELRLLYVAVTHARENLFFTYPNQVYGQTLGIVLNRPSGFIDMMSESILEKQSAGYQGGY